MLGLALGLQMASQIALFLVEAVFSLYIGAVLIRLLLGFARANFNNPLSQFLVKVTNPVLVPMRRFIPSIGKIDTSAVVLAYGLTLIKITLLYLIIRSAVMFPESLIIAIGEIIKTVIWVYIIALILQAVISWVGSAQGNPVSPLVHSLTNPIVRPIRKVVPLIGMMDLSPLVAILGLNVLLIVVNNLFPGI
ncbi:MAG: YggT family protein [Cocleimonas sp.]